RAVLGDETRDLVEHVGWHHRAADLRIHLLARGAPLRQEWRRDRHDGETTLLHRRDSFVGLLAALRRELLARLERDRTERGLLRRRQRVPRLLADDERA